jgi:hypothetical protein
MGHAPPWHARRIREIGTCRRDTGNTAGTHYLRSRARTRR